MTRTTALALGTIAAALLATDARLIVLVPVLAAVLAVVAVGLTLLGRRPAAVSGRLATMVTLPLWLGV